MMRKGRLKRLMRPGFAIALFVVAATQGRGEIRILGVTVASTYAAGLPSAGSLATIFCTGLTNIGGVIQADGGELPRSLAGVQVLMGSVAAPILAVADFKDYQQINFQVPWEPVPTSVMIAHGAERAVTAGLTPNFWSVFFRDAKGYAAAQHASDYRPVTAEDPARSGEFINVYATDLGTIDGPPPTGVPAPFDRKYALNVSQESYYLLMSGGGTLVTFMGLAPGLVGVYQIQFRMPEIADTHDAELSVQKIRHCAIGLPYGDPACVRGMYLINSTTGRLPVAR